MFAKQQMKTIIGVLFLCIHTFSESALPLTFFDLRPCQGLQFYDSMVFLLALQGHVNVESSNPLIFMKTNGNMGGNGNADEAWITYFSRQFNVTHIVPSNGGDICSLYNGFSAYVKGYALFDPTIDASRYIALTLTSLRGLLPVTDALLSENDCLDRNLIQVDVMNMTGGLDSSLAAANWSITHLLPEANRNVVYSVGMSHNGTSMGSDRGVQLGIDGAIAAKSFIFNLSPNGDAYSEQAAMFTKIMDYIGPKPGQVYGWAEPEPVFAKRVSDGGNVIMCSGAPNLSFWAKLPSNKTFRLPSRTTDIVLDRTKHYIAFQTNEGDTPKALVGRFGMSWDARGSIPISWGIDPLVAELYPALVQFEIFC